MLYTIYSITITDTNYIYVGSTQRYNQRIYEHKSNLKLPETHKAYKYKLYEKMREYGIENCVFKPLEHLECDKKQALERETYWLSKLMPDFNTSEYLLKTKPECLNTILPVCNLTKAERDRQYYATHKDEAREYREKNREHIAETSKKRYNENREHYLELAKQYRENNADKIKASNDYYSNLEPIHCECGGSYTYKHKARHEATIPHRLGTDPEFRRQHEEETKKRKEEQAQRKREYKAQYAKDHLEQYRDKYATAEKIHCECGHTYHPKQQKIHLQSVIHRSVMDAEFIADMELKKEESKKKAREYKTNWEREKRLKQKNENA